MGSDIKIAEGVNEMEQRNPKTGKSARAWAAMAAVCLWLLLVLLAPPAQAAGTSAADGTYPWKIPSLGVLKAPVGLEAAEIKEVREALKPEKPGTPGKTQIKGKVSVEKILDPAHPEAAVEMAAQLEMDGYQLTMKDDSGYHLAWFLAMRDRNDEGELNLFFKRSLEAEQLLQLDMYRQLLSNSPENYNYTDPKTRTGIKFLEIYPLEDRALEDGRTYTLAARMMVEAENLKFPVFVRLQVYNLGRQLAGAILVTTDSDREFWDKIFRQLMTEI